MDIKTYRRSETARLLLTILPLLLAVLILLLKLDIFSMATSEGGIWLLKSMIKWVSNHPSVADVGILVLLGGTIAANIIFKLCFRTQDNVMFEDFEKTMETKIDDLDGIYENLKKELKDTELSVDENQQIVEKNCNQIEKETTQLLTNLKFAWLKSRSLYTDDSRRFRRLLKQTSSKIWNAIDSVTFSKENQ